MAVTGTTIEPGPAHAPGSLTVVPIQLYSAAGWGRPGIDDSAIYYLSRHHEIYAVERRTGELRWRQMLSRGVNGLTAGTTVVIDRGVVIAGDDDLFAFDAATGAARWRFAPSIGRSPGPYLGPAIDGIVFAGSASGHVYAVDVGTGQPIWTSAPRGDRALAYAPVADRGLVLATYTDFTVPRMGGIVALDARTGTSRWTVPFPRPSPDAMAPSGAAGGPVVAGDVVVATSSDGAVHAFHRDSGRAAWTLPALPNISEDFRAALFRGRLLVVASLAGVVIAVDTLTRGEVWRYSSPEDGSIAFDIAANADTVFLPFASGRTIAVRLATGRELWRTGGATQRFEHLPAEADGSVYLTSEDGLYVVAKQP